MGPLKFLPAVPTCGGDVSGEAEDQLLSLAHADLGGCFRVTAVALAPQSRQLPAEVSAGEGGHQDGVGRVLPALEEHGDRVAAGRLLQHLCQGGELAGLQQGEETHHQESAGEEIVAE